MPTAHAKLGPSSSSRWIACPASIQMEAKLEKSEKSDGGSDYAHEGTVAHGLADIVLRRDLLREDVGSELEHWTMAAEAEYDELEIKDMYNNVAIYLELVASRLEAVPNSMLLPEQRVDTGLPGCWGTADAIILSPNVIEVIDFKYGKGVPVSAIRNPQARLYLIGAAHTYGDVVNPELGRSWISQPRLDSVSSEEIPIANLMAWRDEVVAPAIAAATGPNPNFGPSESACRFCPVSGQCYPQMVRQTRHDFAADPDFLAPEDIGEALTALPEIRKWCAQVEKIALQKAWSEGEDIPGWKVVKSGGRRQIVDEAAAIQTLIDHGYKAEDVATFSVKGLGKLEELVGRKELPEVLGDLLVKKEGKPAMAPLSSDKPAARPEDDAAADFASEI